MDQLLETIVQFLNDKKIRATYKAVGEAIGVPARSVGRRLGKKRIEASWIVNARTGMPTGYKPLELHPRLADNPKIIATGAELKAQLRR